MTTPVGGGHSLPAGDSPHNYVTLRNYFDVRHDALEKSFNAAQVAQAIALQKAEAAIDLRLASMNEFRAALQDTATRNASKQEVEALRQTMEVRINALRESHDVRIEGLQRIVFIGLGALAAIQFVIGAGLFNWGA